MISGLLMGIKCPLFTGLVSISIANLSMAGIVIMGDFLVGLNIATQHIDKESELYSVFLSGNGPLVKILCEALARDKAKSIAFSRRNPA